MNDAMLDVWCELCEAIWKGARVAITTIVAVALIFNVLFKKKDPKPHIDKAVEVVEQVAHD